jgi:hypothetical protein
MTPTRKGSSVAGSDGAVEPWAGAVVGWDAVPDPCAAGAAVGLVWAAELGGVSSAGPPQAMTIGMSISISAKGTMYLSVDNGMFYSREKVIGARFRGLFSDFSTWWSHSRIELCL